MTPNAQTELHVRPRINRCTPKFQGSSAIAWRRKGPKPSVWQWFAGTSVGYLDDMDDEFWGFHIGAEKLVDCYSHALFLKVGLRYNF
jgi:hypothetical protein